MLANGDDGSVMVVAIAVLVNIINLTVYHTVIFDITVVSSLLELIKL